MSFKTNSFKNFCSGVLRSLMWRLGRRLYCYARNELPVGPLENGEYQLLDYFMKISTNKDLTIFDIGGNKGEWTIAALESSKRYGVKASIHIFEPANDSFSLLQHKFEVQAVKLNKMAVSNLNSVSELFVCGNFCGTNSLYANQGGVPEKIQSIRLDEYVAQHKINHIDFVKSDTEGHDFNVLKSAENLLCDGRVIILQFEYNWRWINARCYLRDVFDFISDKPYWLGKLSASGVEIYKDWHPELDRFFETNYVLVRKDYEAMSKIIKYSKFNSSNIPISFE